MNLILFDGLCNLCNRSVLFVIKRDKQAFFRYASIQSEVGQNILNHLSIDPKKTDTIVYVKGDKYYLQSSAILNILKDLGGVWRLFYAFIIIPRFIRDLVYRIIAKWRYKIFGKRESCTISNYEIKEATDFLEN